MNEQEKESFLKVEQLVELLNQKILKLETEISNLRRELNKHTNDRWEHGDRICR